MYASAVSCDPTVRRAAPATDDRELSTRGAGTSRTAAGRRSRRRSRRGGRGRRRGRRRGARVAGPARGRRRPSCWPGRGRWPGPGRAELTGELSQHGVRVWGVDVVPAGHRRWRGPVARRPEAAKLSPPRDEEGVRHHRVGVARHQRLPADRDRPTGSTRSPTGEPRSNSKVQARRPTAGGFQGVEPLRAPTAAPAPPGCPPRSASTAFTVLLNGWTAKVSA